jgi:hypothetical protein
MVQNYVGYISERGVEGYDGGLGMAGLIVKHNDVSVRVMFRNKHI